MHVCMYVSFFFSLSAGSAGDSLNSRLSLDIRLVQSTVHTYKNGGYDLVL